MAVIKKTGGYNSLPISYKRGNPIPLDKSEIWYDYGLMVAYAQSDATAYVGQILGLVDEKNNTAKAYIILNTDGDLQEVGSAVAVDNASITFTNDSLALNNWGVQYYKYVAAVENEENSVEAHYELQIVDKEHPWVIGLEPRVATNTEGKLVLSWYEPNPTTIEGLNSQVGSIQTSVNNLASNTYTKTEVDSKIASADHLKRKVFDTEEAMKEYIASSEDAEQYIFMVPSGLQEDDNKYYEYIAFKDSSEDTYTVEKVGSWEVDLSEYATSEALENKVDKVEGKSLVSDKLIDKLDKMAEDGEANYISSVTENFTVSNGKLELNEVIANKLDAITLDKDNNIVIESSQVTDLESVLKQSLPFISVSDTDFNISEDGELSLKAVSSSVIEGYSDLQTDVSNLKELLYGVEDEENPEQSVEGLSSVVSGLVSKTETFVTKTDFGKVVGDLDTLLKENRNIILDIDDIYERLKWQTIPEPDNI